MLRRSLPLVAIALLTLSACKDKPAASTATPTTSVTASPSAVSGALASAAPKEAAATPSGDPVTFAHKPPTVGTKRQESGEMAMKMAMTVDAGGQPVNTSMTMTETTKKTEELLAANGEAPTKVKVTFDKIEQRAVEDGKEQSKPSRIAGKTYVVEAKDGKLEVKDDKGKLAPKNEAAEVEKHFRSLGKVDPVASALPKSIRPGEKLDVLAKSLQDYMGQGADGMTVSDVGVTFKEKQGDDGVFTLALKMGKEDAQMALTIALTGEMRISTKTGEPTRLEITGPLTIAPSPKGKMKIDGSGSMSMKMTMTAL